MATPDLPQKHFPGHSDDNEVSNTQIPECSVLDASLTQSPMWNEQTLRDIEFTRVLAARESSDSDTQTERWIFRLTAQLDERNDEIERLRRAVSTLENEKCQLGDAHQREIELQRAELERLQDAYDQFEKESDSLLAELCEQNERLREDCRHRNVRSLLK